MKKMPVMGLTSTEVRTVVMKTILLRATRVLTTAKQAKNLNLNQKGLC
jgi:hypothetical protein